MYNDAISGIVNGFTEVDAAIPDSLSKPVGLNEKRAMPTLRVVAVELMSPAKRVSISATT